MTLAHGFVVQSESDTDAPWLGAVGSIGTTDQGWDDGAWAIGQAAAAAGVLWVDRPYFTGTPDAGWLVGRADQSAAAGAVVQLGNELNLPAEGWVGGPSAWFAVEDAVRAAASFPARLIAMPPSPGLDGWQSWVRPAGDHAAHVYGSYDDMRGLVEWFLAHTDGLVYVTECNWGAGRSVDVAEWAAGELVPFLDWCVGQARVVCALYFAWLWHGAPAMPTPVDAKGGPVEDVMREWMPPANGGAGYPWDSKVMTVWNLPADPRDLVAAAAQLGIVRVEFKTADGGSSWLNSPNRHVDRPYVDALRAGGIGTVCGWSYNYCDLLTGPSARSEKRRLRFGRPVPGGRGRSSWDRGDGVPEDEAAAAAAAVDALGLDGHTFDLEIECEGHGDLVAILLDTARELMPAVPFGCHCWAYRTGHELYPWETIGAGVEVVRPMIYRPTWTAARSFGPRELGPWFGGKVVCPVWGITDPADTVAALTADQAVADANGCPGVGVWEYSGLPGQPGVSDWIAALEVGGEPIAPTDQLGSLQVRTWDALDEVQALAAEWESFGWPSTGSGIAAAAESAKSHVRASKGER